MTTTLLLGGRVHTGGSAASVGATDPDAPAATALLVGGGRVLWVGAADRAPVGARDADEVVQLEGALVTPAFVDAHVHVTETGLALEGVDLSGVTSLAEALDAVGRAAHTTGGRPVLGHGWDERRWPERRAPTLSELDRASYGGVVYLARVDVHSAVVSSALAELAGLRALEGWDGSGRVERDAHHAARAATRDRLSPGSRRDLQTRALQAAAAAGIAAVHEMAAPHIVPKSDLAALLELVAGSDHPLPVVVPYWGEQARDREHALELAADLDLPGGRRPVGLAGDLCADGSIGSRTAHLREPYSDASSEGHGYLSVQELRDHVVACTRAGLQAGFHVIGDAAVDAVLAALDLAADLLGDDAVRAAGHRLEHVEMIGPAGVATLARLGVTASVQPAFDAWWGHHGGMYEERLGSARAAGMNPFGALAGAGAGLALGSDSPVTPFAPWEAVRACLDHHDPAQRLTLARALDAHTAGGWLAGGDVSGGTLVAGAPATYAVWRAESLGPDGLPVLDAGAAAPECLRTVESGRLLHDRRGG